MLSKNTYSLFSFQQNLIESSLRKVSELKRDPARKLAAQALDLIGFPIPKALTLKVYMWPTEDVVCWINRVGHFIVGITRFSLLRIMSSAHGLGRL